MSLIIGITGRRGTGKSTSYRNLDPKSTYIFSGTAKPMPFPMKGYTKGSNYDTGTDKDSLNQFIKRAISDKECKVIVIDDYNMFASKHIVEAQMANKLPANHAKWDYIYRLQAEPLVILEKYVRQDQILVIATHEQIIEYNGEQIMTVSSLGKASNNYMSLASMTLIHFFTHVGEPKDEDSFAIYKFQTGTDGFNEAKSPMGMFNKRLIDNDLKPIIEHAWKFTFDQKINV